jgi:hypothetical protein
LVTAFTTASSEDKSSIRSYINLVIHQFKLSPTDLWTIQELVILSGTNDKDIFIRILDQLLRAEKESIAQPILVIHGLAALLDSATEQVDLRGRYGIFSDTLKSLKGRLESVCSDNNDDELLPLLWALTSLFKAMLCRGIKGLDRENVYNPLMKQFESLGKSNSIEISFLANHATRSLAYIGNDESTGMSIYRHGKLAIGIVMDAKEIVVNFNIAKFEDIYNKIMDMKDFSINLGWYGALMFVDSLLVESRFEKLRMFVTNCQYKLDTKFIQGVCLRLVEVAVTHKDHETSNQAIELLKYIKNHNTDSIQKTAKLSIERIQGNDNPN